jgi:hypothetical protein
VRPASAPPACAPCQTLRSHSRPLGVRRAPCICPARRSVPDASLSFTSARCQARSPPTARCQTWAWERTVPDARTHALPPCQTPAPPRITSDTDTRAPPPAPCQTLRSHSRPLGVRRAPRICPARLRAPCQTRVYRRASRLTPKDGGDGRAGSRLVSDAVH